VVGWDGQTYPLRASPDVRSRMIPLRAKIAALERLAASPSASPGERDNARRAAAALRKKLNETEPAKPPPNSWVWGRDFGGSDNEDDVGTTAPVGARPRRKTNFEQCAVCGTYGGHLPSCPNNTEKAPPRAPSAAVDWAELLDEISDGELGRALREVLDSLREVSSEVAAEGGFRPTYFVDCPRCHAYPAARYHTGGISCPQCGLRQGRFP